MGIYGDISDQEYRRLTGRLHRVEGQLRGLEKLLSSGESPLLVIAQFDAAIAAARAAQYGYIEAVIDGLPPDERQRLIKRLVRKG
jgi:DNA-binding FrmR family transcriptional regulator